MVDTIIHKASLRRTIPLLARLYLVTLLFAAPTFAFCLFVAWLSGWASSVFWITVSCIVNILLLIGAHLVGGMVILPAQNNNAALTAWLAKFSLFQKWLPDLPAFARFFANRAGVATKQRNHLLDAFGGKRFNVITPDRVVVDGLWFEAAGVPKGAVIYVNGNGELCELTYRQAIADYRSEGFSYACFNYRGVGESTGQTSRNGAVIDLACVVDLVIGLGYKPNKITLIGHSLGGAIAAEVAPHFPGIHICNDRSFSSLSLVAQHLLAGTAVVNSDKPLHRLICHAVAILIRHLVVWEMDALSHWQRITSGHRWHASVRTDAIILPPTQLATGLKKLQHSGKLTDIGHELLMGPGSDGHNRAFTPAEMRQMVQRLTKAMCEE